MESIPQRQRHCSYFQCSRQVVGCYVTNNKNKSPGITVDVTHQLPAARPTAERGVQVIPTGVSEGTTMPSKPRRRLATGLLLGVTEVPRLV